MLTKPSWHSEISLCFQSLKTQQFLLHGNTHDLWFNLNDGLSQSAYSTLDLPTYLNTKVANHYHVILSYQVGEGIEVLKGKEILAHSDAYKTIPLKGTPTVLVNLLQQFNLFLDHYSSINKQSIHVCFIIKDAHLICPNEASNLYFELNSLSSVIRNWSLPNSNPYYQLLSFVITEQLMDINKLIRQNALCEHIHVGLPTAPELAEVVTALEPNFKKVLSNYATNIAGLCQSLRGLSYISLHNLLRTSAYNGTALQHSDLAKLRKELVEKESNGLIEFIESNKTLDDLKGQKAIIEYLRTDLKLFRDGVIQAVPMGYLFSGPVGSGKTYTVKCIAGEAQIPVVVLKNFRDKWVGSSEANLEKIFNLIRALGQCIVFVDEADQALGKRETANSGGGDVGGRLYGMMAEFMSNPDHRGKIIWILATSRPDLIEVDLKRPGRIDTKIPLLPTLTKAESYDLLRSLLKAQSLEIPATAPKALDLPLLLTPGAANAIASQIFKQFHLSKTPPIKLLTEYLKTYQPPVPYERIKHQMRLSLEETTEPSLIPKAAKELAEFKD